MIRSKLYILVFLMVFACLSCKKVTKQVDSEKPFVLYVMDKKGVLKNYCFDHVNGKGKSGLNACSNYNQGIKLPLAIDKDSCIYYFGHNKKTDSLVVYYKKYTAVGSGEYDITYTVTKLKTSFDSLSRNCIPELTQNCNGNQAPLSAVVFN